MAHSGKKNHEPLASVLALTTAFFILYVFHQSDRVFYLACAIGLVGVLFPHAASVIDFLWRKLAQIPSIIIPKLLLAFIYFFIFTPMAIFSKLTGNSEPIQLKNNRQSQFVDRNKSFSKEFFEKTW